jgi:glycogen operon protein
MNVRVWPGEPHTLGATWDGEGVNFALFSENAEQVELCLFDHVSDTVEAHRIALAERTNHVWHAYLPDLRPGQLYAYRVHGPYAPTLGHRFNAKKLLLDPYAKAIAGNLRAHKEMYGYDRGHPDLDLAIDAVDSITHVPKCVVMDTAFTWGDDRLPRTPMSRTLIYECHVKGMTARHPEVPEQLRGTYLGLVSTPILEHLQALGVTAVELLPVHQTLHDERLLDLGLANYWGYNSIGFFAPDPRFASGCEGTQVTEFKTMVKAFHRAGIEVILDVVYNHTGEGNELGPSICFRGIDNASYYRLAAHDRRRTVDFTGCGNSLNVLHPRVLQLVLDSLRYWVTEMHVDGFRFDLAPTLARDPHEFDVNSRFLMTIQQDPVLSRVKLIAEPWDIGPGGYRLGGFPPGWAEWNGRFRDCVRRFWRGDAGQTAELASRLSGSSDLFASSGRGPLASINFVACHDGFTLNDLVSYEKKHNLANGEDNRDGSNDNASRNWGVEGETKSTGILRLRERMRRNLLATLALAQGVPMLSQGDEFGRTQHGNNNAYCHDSPLAWVDWTLAPADHDLLEFSKELFRIVRSHRVLRRRHFFLGRAVGTEPVRDARKDVTWLRPDGTELKEEDWTAANDHCLGMLIRGDVPELLDELGHALQEASLYVFLNASHRSKTYTIPRFARPGIWRELLNTAQPPRRLGKVSTLSCAPHALNLLSYDWTTG